MTKKSIVGVKLWKFDFEVWTPYRLDILIIQQWSLIWLLQDGAVHKNIYWLFYSTAELQKSNKWLTDNILLLELVSYAKIHWDVCVWGGGGGGGGDLTNSIVL